MRNNRKLVAGSGKWHRKRWSQEIFLLVHHFLLSADSYVDLCAGQRRGNTRPQLCILRPAHMISVAIPNLHILKVDD